MPYPLSRNNITEPKAKSGRTAGLDDQGIFVKNLRQIPLVRNLKKIFIQVLTVLTFCVVFFIEKKI